MGDEMHVRRRRMERRLTRRRFIGGLGLLSGGGLLAACGATATPTIGAPPATNPAATATTAIGPASTATRGTPVAATPTNETRATPPRGTATRAASPSVGTATRTTGSAPATELGRLLGLVPQSEKLPGRNGIWFADAARQRRNYGFAEVTSPEAARAIGGDFARFTNTTILALPYPPEAGSTYAGNSQWRAALGYDFWQIERTIAAGDSPQVWSHLEGRFDRAAIEAALLDQGYATVEYGGHTYLSRFGDLAVTALDDPIVRFTLSRLNRVAPAEGALTTAATTATIEAAIDAAAGRRPTFAADPDHAALATALGPVVGAILAPPDEFYTPPPIRTDLPSAAATAIATRYAEPARAHLPPYRLVGLGLRDDGTTHTMVIALVYASAEEARAAAPIVRQRAEGYTSVRINQSLRERAVPGEPEIVSAGGRTVLVQPFAIADEANLSLYLKMYTTRDLLFLAE